MELENRYQDNFTKSSVFKDKIKELDSGFGVLVDEFKKLFVLYNMYPNNQEYQQQYQNTLNNLDRVMSKLFSVSNDIERNVDDINKQLFEYDGLIKKEKKKNINFKAKLGIVEDKNNAAFEMITDYKDIYNKSYLRNVSLILSSIICLLAIVRVY
jgi:hypothetical protein